MTSECYSVVLCLPVSSVSLWSLVSALYRSRSGDLILGFLCSGGYEFCVMGGMNFAL